MSESIYTYIPHFYIIQHINSGKFYAGVRYGKNANPEQLLKNGGYQTSSDVVKQIILEEGLESFIIRKIRVFETGKEALEYEYRYLRRVNAAFNDNFLNRSNCSIDTLNVDWEKLRKTNLSRYGFEHATQSPEIKEKSKKTCLSRFGCEFSLQSEEVRNKGKETMLERYGVTNILQNEQIKEKKKESMIKNFGVPHALQSEELKEKYKQTIMNNFNVSYPMQSEEVREKQKQNNLVKYGFGNVFQTEVVKEKSKQKMMENYGFSYASQVPELKEKSKNTLLKKYGVTNPSQVPEFQEKKKYTSLERCGCEHNSQTPEFKEKLRKIISDLLNQPTIAEIIKYRDKFKLKLGSNWYYKPQEILDGILAELKLTYGEISENI